MANREKLTRQGYVLLVLLTIVWGLNWPVMKYGVSGMPPLTFRSFILLGASALLFGVARAQGLRVSLTTRELRWMFVVALPNVFLWQAFSIYGIKMLSSGRSAILAYTKPVWTATFGVLFFGQVLSRRLGLGVLLGFSGVALLLFKDWQRIQEVPLGALLMLLAAAIWGLGTLLLKYNPAQLPALTITLWMSVISCPLMFVAAALLEWDQLHWSSDPLVWLALLYNITLSYAFGQWAWIRITQLLSPAAAALSVLFVPVIGVFSGMWLLGEVPSWADFGGLAFVMAAIATVL